MRHRAAAWTNADLVWIGPLGIKFNKIWVKILTTLYVVMELGQYWFM